MICPNCHAEINHVTANVEGMAGLTVETGDMLTVGRTVLVRPVIISDIRAYCHQCGHSPLVTHTEDADDPNVYHLTILG